MRKADTQQDTLFSTVIPEERVPKGRPLRPIRKRVNAALKQMQGQIKLLSGQGNWSVDIAFNELYSVGAWQGCSTFLLLRMMKHRQLWKRLNGQLLTRLSGE